MERTVADLTDLTAPLAAQLGTYQRIHRASPRYDLFRQRGLFCGNEPVEAAHRTLIQARPKRSGQRWSINELDRLVRLHSAPKSSQCYLFTKIFKKPPAKF